MEDEQKLAELTAKAIIESAQHAVKRATALADDVDQSGKMLIADLESMIAFVRDNILRMTNNLRRDLAQFSAELETRSKALSEKTSAYMTHGAASAKAFEDNMPSRGDLPDELKLPRVVTQRDPLPRILRSGGGTTE